MSDRTGNPGNTIRKRNEERGKTRRRETRRRRRHDIQDARQRGALTASRESSHFLRCRGLGPPLVHRRFLHFVSPNRSFLTLAEAPRGWDHLVPGLCGKRVAVRALSDVNVVDVHVVSPSPSQASRGIQAQAISRRAHGDEPRKEPLARRGCARHATDVGRPGSDHHLRWVPSSLNRERWTVDAAPSRQPFDGGTDGDWDSREGRHPSAYIQLEFRPSNCPTTRLSHIMTG